MSSHFTNAFGSAIRTFSKSGGNSCTTPADIFLFATGLRARRADLLRKLDPVTSYTLGGLIYAERLAQFNFIFCLGLNEIDGAGREGVY